jgi:hypothetical protein
VDTQRVGPYRLVSCVGSGGMGVVHLALGSGNCAVAVKLLRPEVAGDAVGRARFAREVATLRRVRGPHVAEVLDADVTGDPPYLVTRYVPGPELEALVAEHGPLAGADLHRVAAGLADALVAIHSAGVVHRDLKPGNVLVLDGEPVVIDFGIARESGGAALTSAGLLVGTPGYLAPEVVRGEPVTAAADVFAWGATVAYAATGRPPYGRGPMHEVLTRVAAGRPDLAGVPPALAPVVRAAMADPPARRPPAGQLLAVLRDDASATTVLRLPTAMLAAPGAGDTKVGPPVALLEPGTTPLPSNPAAAAAPPAAPGPPTAAGTLLADPAGTAIPRPPRAGRVALSLALLALAAAGGAYAPAVTALAVGATAVLLRAVAASAAAHGRRLARRGPRWWDAPLTVTALPYRLLAAVPGTLLVIVAAVALGLVAATVVLLADASAPAPRALAAGTGCFVLALVTCCGGRSSPARAGARPLLDPLARRGRAVTAAVAALLAAAVVLAVAATARGPAVWPGDRTRVERLLERLPAR